MTREEELIRIAKKLDKMVSRNNTEGAIDLLKELKGFNMTLKLLQETRIGMSVNGIRKNCTDEEVIALAKFLIKDWKRLLDSGYSEKEVDPKNGLELVGSASPPHTSPQQTQSRKDSKDSQKHSHVSKPSSPPVKRPSLEIKRRFPPDPNTPIAPLPLHLHPPPARKEPPDPNAPVPPLPLHLHPPPPAPKRLSQDGKKDRKEPSDKPSSQMKMSEDVKKDRKESSEIKVSKKQKEVKKERLACPEAESNVKKPSVDVKKGLQRRESSDSKPGQPQKRPSTDSKHDRRESTDSKRSISPPPKKLSSERRESLGSKSSVQSGPPQRKLSIDSNDRKSKVDVPKTPTTPTSPMSPGFGPTGGPLSPHLCTGDSIRDKCIELIAAALRTDDDYKEFGVNCDSMGAEIEDYIYQDIKATDMKYKNRVRSRISNLKDPKNPGLRKNVLARNIDLSRIASMSAEEMASDELKQLRNVLTQEAIREHQMAKTGGTTTGLLQCGKCKKKNCTYNQVQTRSADEPMTTFVLCNECGNRWKFC